MAAANNPYSNFGKTPQPQAPGPQQPTKYPFVGPAYRYWGEQPGFVYDPYRDSYRADPKTQRELYESQGLVDKKPSVPGLGATLGATLGVGGALALGQGLGQSSGSFLGGLLGGGTTAATTGTAAQGAGTLAAPVLVGVGSPAASAAPAAATASAGMLGTAIPIAGIAAGTYLGGKAAYNMIKGKKDNSIPGLIGRGTLGIATGGLSEIARPFLTHESTRDVAKKHTQSLLEQGKDNQNWQGYVAAMREQHNSAPPDPSKPFAGKYANWEEYKKAGLEAGDLTGVYGNLKVYGPQWAALTQEQRQAVTQANINDGLYTSKKGEVELTNPEKALANLQTIIGAQNKGPAPIQPGQTPQSTAAAASGGMIAPVRSNTRSPGIDKNGRRISY
jgi:hypothetical protein